MQSWLQSIVPINLTFQLPLIVSKRATSPGLRRNECQETNQRGRVAAHSSHAVSAESETAGISSDDSRPNHKSGPSPSATWCHSGPRSVVLRKLLHHLIDCIKLIQFKFRTWWDKFRIYI